MSRCHSEFRRSTDALYLANAGSDTLAPALQCGFSVCSELGRREASPTKRAGRCWRAEEARKGARTAPKNREQTLYDLADVLLQRFSLSFHPPLFKQTAACARNDRCAQTAAHAPDSRAPWGCLTSLYTPAPSGTVMVRCRPGFAACQGRELTAAPSLALAMQKAGGQPHF